MRLNPFSKKTTTGYYERLKAECADLALQVQEAKAAADHAKADYEAKVQTSCDMEVRYADKHFLTEQESQARRERDDAYNRAEDLRRKAWELEHKHNRLRWTVEAPARMDEVKQTIAHLRSERAALSDEAAKTEGLIAKLHRRVEDLEQRIARETQAASQSMVAADGEFVMPEALTRLDVELRVTRATLAERQSKLAELKDALALIPDQVRDAQRTYGSARAAVAEIELQEQLPNWLDVIALAALSASSDARKYVIEIPPEAADAARAKLAADMPKA
jgi:chromosome segregation ATPase